MTTANTTSASMIARVRDIVLDPSPGRVFLDAELLRILNQGQAVVADAMPSLFEQYGQMSLARGAHQSIPHAWLRFLGVVANTNAQTGAAIRLANMEDLEQTRPTWATPTLSSGQPVQYYLVDPSLPRSFYVYPAPASGSTHHVMVRYVPAPAALTGASNELLSLPDYAVNILLDWVLSRVYTKDGAFPHGREMAASYHQRYLDGVAMLRQVDTVHAPTPLRRRAASRA